MPTLPKMPRSIQQYRKEFHVICKFYNEGAVGYWTFKFLIEAAFQEMKQTCSEAIVLAVCRSVMDSLAHPGETAERAIVIDD